MEFKSKLLKLIRVRLQIGLFHQQRPRLFAETWFFLIRTQFTSGKM